MLQVYPLLPKDIANSEDALILARLLTANLIPYHLSCPKGKRFHKDRLPWLNDLPELERWQVELDLQTKDHLETQIRTLTDRLLPLSHKEPWAEQAMLLMQIPSVGRRAVRSHPLWQRCFQAPPQQCSGADTCP